MKRFLDYVNAIVKDRGNMASKPTYGIINLTSRGSLYSYFDKVKKRYYENRNVLFKYVFNEPNDRHHCDHEMVYKSDCTDISGRPVMLEKFLWALNVLLEVPEWRACDYIIRTNSSTFINLELLEPLLSLLPRKRCYAGKITFNRFVSGTCIIFSRDVVEYLQRIMPGKEKYDYDDLVIRRYMKKRLIRMRDIDMAYYDTSQELNEEKLIDDLKKYPLIRINNSVDRYKYDCEIWHKISEIKKVELVAPNQDIQ